MDKVSVIVPAYNEEENVPVLLDELAKMVETASFPIEVIIVDDGSSDQTYKVARGLKPQYPFLKVARHRRNMGKTEAFQTGFKVSEGEILVIFDADLQYHPSDIVRLVEKMEEGYDVVTGWKTGDYKKRFVSGIYNWLSRKIFKIPVHDQNSVKVLRREVIENFTLRKDWHRYMVAFAVNDGYKVTEIKVKLYPRRFGTEKYSGFGRVFIGLLDMIAVKFQISFMRKPMLYFGYLGGSLVLLAFIVGLIGLYMRFVLLRGYRPLAYLVIFLGLSGMLLFVMGFLAEAIASIRDELKMIRKEKFLD
ncbi:glycosyltransferase family 2 protein [bacterium]|nr:glycosyltransferase family 2 protein [bacterium]